MPAEPTVLAITCWGTVWRERNFDIFADEHPVANRPDDFFEQ